MPVDAWQLDVSAKLGALIQQTTDLTEQVKRQNGNVARLWEHMNSMEQHPASCPLNERVNAVETAVAEDRAADRASARATAPWHRWAERAGIGLVGAVILLLALHVADLLKFWRVSP